MGWPIKARAHVYDKARYLTVVAPRKQFYCNGEVTMWRYQITRATQFQAIVFRSVSGSTTKFQVVGVNIITIPPGEIDKPVSYMVPEEQRIRVEAGDVIGWSFGDAAITLDIHGSSVGAESNLVRWAPSTYPVPLHGIISFVGSGSREYSIEATVQVSVTKFKGKNCL